ncbi:MAG TPA: DUF58 domain-containing protein [Burkholderiaceae bacterium]|nr:DUF58 domain-containing protein [Burkholderiaceae bacterium]
MSALFGSRRIADWIEKYRAVETGDVLLDRHRIYILPTRTGLTFWLVVFVLLIGSINFSLQLGYLLTFTIVSMALISMYHTHCNLSGLTIRGQRADPVHAGDVASFELTINNPFPTERYALNFNFMLPARRWRVPAKELEEPMPGTWVDVPARSVCRVGVGLPTRRRGRRECPRIRLSTRFPFGLWEAWSYLRPDLTTVVYPSPEIDAPPLPPAGMSRDELSGIAAGGDEFSGVRPYQAGDPQKMIAWRLAARSDELSVKFFESTGGGDVLLAFDSLPPALSVEQRVSRLAAWVLMAEAAGLSYALQLPAARIDIGRGHEHCERCLEALALFES